MIRLVTLAAVFTLFMSASQGQSNIIKGIVQDETDKSPVRGATVSLLLQADSSLVKSTLTDSTGFFQFTDVAIDSFIVTVENVSYQQLVSFLTMKAGEKDLGSLALLRQGQDLTGVTVVAKVAPVTQRGDTAQYSASQYKVNPDATVEDLIKKMPDITVAKDGTVTAQGETVRKVTIDGKDFFGDDASAALKNLPSEVVDKIQVFDRLSDQAQLTGVDDGNSQKSINVVTKAGIKNGQFGRIYAGYGTDDRYAAGGNVSFFKGERRLSIVGNFNNINQQNFGSQDLLGLTSSGGGRGGGGRGGGPGGGGPGGGWGGGNDNFSIAQASGISKTNALGLNFSNQYGKKLILSASYFFNQSNTDNNSRINTETFSDPKSQYSTQNSVSFTDNYNHRFNMRMEYKIDSNNSLFIIPSISIQGNNSDRLSNTQNYYGLNDSISTSLINSMSDRKGYNIRNNIMYRHSFAKRGRTLSLGFNTNFSRNESEAVTDAFYRFFNNGFVEDSIRNQLSDNLTNGESYTGTISYTEPIGKKGQLQLEYSPSVQKNKADQETFLYDGAKYTQFAPKLSNTFDNTITTNRGGLTYRFTKDRDNMFSIGMNVQNAKLESERIFPTKASLNQSFYDFLPNAMWRAKISPVSSIRLFYRASVNFPSVNQLQDVVDVSNPLRVSVGNPNLRQSNTHFLGGRYAYTNTKKSTSFFANVFGQVASDYITNATYIASQDSLIQNGDTLKRGSQLTKPINLDGYKTLRTFFTYSMPIKAIKTNVNLNAGFNYSQLPGLVNNTIMHTDNFIYSGGIVLASNVSEYVDFNINYNVNFNEAKNSFNTRLNNRFINQSAGVALNLLSKAGWFVQNDVNAQKYSGLSEGLNQSFVLWNAAIGKKFLKNQAGELKLSVFDLLKQNRSINRTVTENYIEDVQNQVLTQYFMLTFTYKLKNFGTAAAASRNRQDGQGRQGGQMGNPGF